MSENPPLLPPPETSQRNRMKVPYRQLFWLCTVGVLILSLVPSTEKLPSTGWDKTNHLLGFALLATFGCLGYPARVGLLLVGLLVYGGLIEMLQSLTTYRFAEWGDFIANGIGIVAGYGGQLMFGLIRKRPDS